MTSNVWKRVAYDYVRLFYIKHVKISTGWANLFFTDNCFAFHLTKNPFRCGNCTCCRVMCVNCKGQKQMTKKLLSFIWVSFFGPPCVIILSDISLALALSIFALKLLFSIGYTQYIEYAKQSWLTSPRVQHLRKNDDHTFVMFDTGSIEHHCCIKQQMLPHLKQHDYRESCDWHHWWRVKTEFILSVWMAQFYW